MRDVSLQTTGADLSCELCRKHTLIEMDGVGQEQKSTLSVLIGLSVDLKTMQIIKFLAILFLAASMEKF